MAMFQTSSRPLTLSHDAWLEQFRQKWIQGEHVLLCGGTGTGKTNVATDILDIRAYVCVLAVKEHDDTLQRFRDANRYGHPAYKVIRTWPPDHVYRHVVLWVKPQGVNNNTEQATKIYRALNAIYKSGGWCIFFDDAGFIAGNLGMGGALGVLLNQGRSSYISVVAAVTRPTSMIARIPRETLNQPRHKVLFKYSDWKEIKACSEIAGMSQGELTRLMDMLRYHRAKDGSKFTDFLYIHEGDVCIVENTGA